MAPILEVVVPQGMLLEGIQVDDMLQGVPARPEKEAWAHLVAVFPPMAPRARMELQAQCYPREPRVLQGVLAQLHMHQASQVLVFLAFRVREAEFLACREALQVREASKCLASLELVDAVRQSLQAGEVHPMLLGEAWVAIQTLQGLRVA